jgi:hypothetical protein
MRLLPPPTQALRNKGKRSWKQLGPREKAQLLGALDSISFDFVEAVKENGGSLADAWLGRCVLESVRSVGFRVKKGKTSVCIW